MPSLKSLRLRIKSVKNTRQITKTMKMVAAAKVRRARSAVESARPYAAKLADVLNNLAGSASSGGLMMTGRPTVKTVRLIVMGSDRGLCGGLNANLIKAATRWIAEQHNAHRMVQLVTVGRKARDGLKSLFGPHLVHSYTDMGRSVEFAHAQTIADASFKAFESGEADEVHVLYSELVSMLTQQPKVRQILPFRAADDGQPLAGPAKPDKAQQGVADYEPSEEAVLEKLLPLNLNMQVFSALLETSASEQAARMTAMDSATRNAGEMIQKLSLVYNRSRQAAITKELIEIISGAEAL